MSIISEALKKARQAREDISPLLQKPVVRGDARCVGSNRAPWFALLVLIVVTGPLGFPLATRFFHRGAAQESIDAGPVTSRGQFSIEERPLFMGAGMSERPVFALSGIAQFQRSCMAVVNGHIIKEGERVQGATVVAIRPNAVELEYHGERIVLEKSF